jgi:hypothetical protein
MGRMERQALIKQIQEDRGGRLLLSYVTSTRTGHEVQIGDDVVRLMYEVLESDSTAAAKGVDLFIYSNGGSATMHRMGCLGPIDPSIQGIFNPPSPNNPQVPAPISVEDVSAYFKLVKDEVGITHEDELVKALIALTEKVHPLALGNVHRSHNQSRMTARKLLKKHTSDQPNSHEIEQMIDMLKSNLFFHGHPINRDEAIADLKATSSPRCSNSPTQG